MNKVTNYWNNRPITLDEEKYYYQEMKDPKHPSLFLYSTVQLIDKKNNNIVFEGICPRFIIQIEEYEFIASSLKNKEECIFQHFHYSTKTKSCDNIFIRIYKSRSIFSGSVDIINNIIILKGWDSTTIYNYSEKKSLKLNDITDIKISPNTNDYLIGEIDIDDKDLLTMYINKKSLEFSEFYSSMQQRIIPIISNSKEENYDFESRLYMTIEIEIKEYIKKEKLKRKERIKDVQKILLRKLK